MKNAQLQGELLDRLNCSDQPFTATFIVDVIIAKRAFVASFFHDGNILSNDWKFNLNIDNKVWFVDSYNEKAIKFGREINGRFKYITLPLSLLSDIKTGSV